VEDMKSHLPLFSLSEISGLA